jgi:hypothetical protein
MGAPHGNLNPFSPPKYGSSLKQLKPLMPQVNMIVPLGNLCPLLPMVLFKEVDFQQLTLKIVQGFKKFIHFIDG